MIKYHSPDNFYNLHEREEVVFIWGSKQFLLNQSESVTISLLFYLISVIISLIGMYWVYHDPLKRGEVETGYNTTM